MECRELRNTVTSLQTQELAHSSQHQLARPVFQKTNEGESILREQQVGSTGRERERENMYLHICTHLSPLHAEEEGEGTRESLATASEV